MHLRLTSRSAKKAILVPTHDLVVTQILKRPECIVLTANFQGEVLESFEILDDILRVVSKVKSGSDKNLWSEYEIELFVKYIR